MKQIFSRYPMLRGIAAIVFGLMTLYGAARTATQPSVDSKDDRVISGTIGIFGGPGDTLGAGNTASDTSAEGLAIYDQVDVPLLLSRHLLLDAQPPGTTGLARRLDPRSCYVAARWGSWSTPGWSVQRSALRTAPGLLSVSGGPSVVAWPVDYGPAESTGRALDVSPGAARALGADTGSSATFRWPWEPKTQ